MSAKRLLDLINEKYGLPDENLDYTYPNVTVDELIKTINDFVEEEDKKYQKNKENRALTFGKYRGYTIKELSLTEKGKSYLSWLLTQKWCTEDKFPYIYEDCKKYKIKKNYHRKPRLD